MQVVLCCRLCFLHLYFFLCFMPENFQMQQQKYENIVQAIPLFPCSPCPPISNTECCFCIKFFSSYALFLVSEHKTLISWVLCFHSLIIVYSIHGMMSWNTPKRGQLLANFHSYTRNHCKQTWCYTSLATCIGETIYYSRERGAI